MNIYHIIGTFFGIAAFIVMIGGLILQQRKDRTEFPDGIIPPTKFNIIPLIALITGLLCMYISAMLFKKFP